MIFRHPRWPAAVAVGSALAFFAAGSDTFAQQQPATRGGAATPRGRQGEPVQPGQQQGRGRRGGPPQPQQKQGVEYFLGTWTFTWTGRESPLTVGPRSGSTTFTRQGPSGFEFRTEGKVEDTGAAFKESGTAQWDEASKTLTFKETLSNGTQLTGTGNWSSPLSIRYESEPVKAGGETLRIRRTYSILAAHSFSVIEEISTDGGAFSRLGNGVFTKSE